MHDDLRQSIRQLLAEQIALLEPDQKHRLRERLQQKRSAPDKPVIQEELVSVSNDRELAELVRRISELVSDPDGLSRLRQGQHVFRLRKNRTDAAQDSRTASAAQVREARFEQGLFCERDCHRLAAEIKSLFIGKNVRITPLAGDSLRRRGISIHREEH